jgi:predicted dienelactone hydrolase
MKSTCSPLRLVTTLLLVLSGACGLAYAAAPAAGTAFAGEQVCEAEWHDAPRSRIIPVRIRMPTGTNMTPVILFSHGLGGDLDAGTLWAKAWVADGNAVIHLQHAGSDSDMLGGGKLHRAISIEQLRARASDVQFVIGEIERHPREGSCELNRIDLRRVGVAGHSFGAQTTLAVAGQTFPRANVELSDPRIKAAVALSPQPALAQPDEIAFAGITMPFLSITGTKDVLPWLDEVTAQDRERPFRAMAPGDKFLLVLEGATHRMFGGQDNLRLTDSAPPAHVREAVTQATTLFWRAALREDAEARRRLERFGATLAPGDRFEHR